MAYDDIIIGSGLSGLATAMGLSAGRRILVLSEAEPALIRYYDTTSGVPSARRGPNGLGSFWHGVIPFGGKAGYAHGNKDGFEALFRRFYPRVDIEDRFGTEWLFVPRRPIRPAQWWPRLIAERGDRLEIRPETAVRFSLSNRNASVESNSGTYHASRVWICAGPLDTPGLLTRSLGSSIGFRGTADDHAIAYLGQVDRRTHPATPRPQVARLADGFWLAALPATTPDCLVTAKPAWFSYRHLDHGIEQRATFGLPVGGAISKIVRAGSLGLLAEAAFNKLGLFGGSSMLSVYGQVHVPAAHQLDLQTGTLETSIDTVRRHVDTVRRSINLPGLVASRRPELFIRGIHLHNTLDLSLLASAGINTLGGPVQVMDASVIQSIGGEHHTFHMMAAALTAARQI